MASKITPTGREAFFRDDQVIVSKTDLKGRITYTNRVFMEVSGYEEKELLRQPHSMIRHPEMPRCIFKLLWDTLQNGDEIFAYVINLCKNGDHYWVLAHVTPSLNENREIVGYHSNRRVPKRPIIDGVIIPLYRELCEEENRYENRKEGLEKSFARLTQFIAEKGMAYDELIFSLQS